MYYLAEEEQERLRRLREQIKQQQQNPLLQKGEQQQTLLPQGPSSPTQYVPQYIDTPYGVARNPEWNPNPPKVSTPYNGIHHLSDAQHQLKLNNQKYIDKYNNDNQLLEILKNLNLEDWVDIGKSALGGIISGVEKHGDVASLGLYAQANRLMGGDYAQRNQQYHQAAQDAGIDEWAKFNDRIIDTVGSNLGLGKYLGNFTGKVFPITNPVSKFIQDDIISNGITNANREGNIESFAEGGKDSNSIKLLEYLLELLG